MGRTWEVCKGWLFKAQCSFLTILRSFCSPYQSALMTSCLLQAHEEAQARKRAGPVVDGPRSRRRVNYRVDNEKSDAEDLDFDPESGVAAGREEEGAGAAAAGKKAGRRRKGEAGGSGGAAKVGREQGLKGLD